MFSIEGQGTLAASVSTFLEHQDDHCGRETTEGFQLPRWPMALERAGWRQFSQCSHRSYSSKYSRSIQTGSPIRFAIERDSALTGT